jgi:hypothetical protein
MLFLAHRFLSPSETSVLTTATLCKIPADGILQYRRLLQYYLNILWYTSCRLYIFKIVSNINEATQIADTYLNTNPFCQGYTEYYWVSVLSWSPSIGNRTQTFLKSGSASVHRLKGEEHRRANLSLDNQICVICFYQVSSIEYKKKIK